MTKQSLKFYFHSLRGDVAKQFQNILKGTTLGAFTVHSDNHCIRFASTKHGRLNAVIMTTEKDKVKLELQTYCPVLIAEIESGIKKAVFKKDIIIVNEMHQRNLNGMRAKFFPFDFDFLFIGHDLKTWQKVYLAQVIDRDVVIFEHRGTFSQIQGKLSEFHREKFSSLKPIKNIGIQYEINWN